MSRLSELVRLINQPCQDMTALMSKAMDADLPFRERFAYKLHLLYCTACRRYRKQLRGLRTALRRIADSLADAETAPGPGPRLSRAARQRIARALQDH
jgi:anti-sigma factor RsiW